MAQSQKPSRPRCAVVSLRLPGADWIRATEEPVAAYARRHGLELVPLREERLDLTVLRWRRRYRNRHLEKFQIYDLLADYDRILYVDADVLIHPEAPNIFDHVPADAFGAVDEWVGVEAPKREQEWRAMQRRLGKLSEAPTAYFNAGVMVASQIHRNLFDYRRRKLAAGRWPDQNTLNYHVASDRVPMCWLGAEWNCLPAFTDRFSDDSKRRASWMIHYAGESAKSLLAADLQYFYGATPATRVV